MTSSNFASRYRKDLSTDMIRTRIAHRKSMSQKENRHKEYERNRHFGLKDINIPILEGRIFAELDASSQELVPEKTSVKTRSTKAVLGDQRKQMLQKYKEEKELQKLREQREKAKRGVFKVGRYRPDMPSFLWSVSSKNALKAEPKKAVPSSVRVTRSKAKDLMDQAKVDNRSDIQAIQPGQSLTSEKKVLDKEKKAVQPAILSSMRMTRSAAQAKHTAKAVSSTTTRNPVSRVTNDNEPEGKAPIKGRPVKKIETKPNKDISFKIEKEENALDSQTSAINGMDPYGGFSKMESLPKTNTAKIRERNSFAPKDFMFQPLDGLKTYQATPMTPRSADAFLTPSSSWTPLNTKIDKTQEATKEILAHNYKTYSTETVHQDSNKLPCPLGSLTAWDKEHVLNKNEATTKNSNGLPIIEVVPSLEINEGQIYQLQHDVPYFRNILQSETEKLTSHCIVWESKLELDIPDDAKDLIRTAVGQTRLLMKERFKQFEGLVNDCEYKRGEKETTCTDLDGFWDMVSFQKKVISGIANKPKKDDGGRIAARNRLAAIKNAMRDRIKQEEHAEAATSLIPKEVDKIVFDAGFFRIESPVKSFSGLSISSEHLSQGLRTPKSVSKAVSQSKAEMGLLIQPTSPKNPDPQSTKSKHPVDKILFSNTTENRNSVVEDARSPDALCPGFQDLIEVNHKANKINSEMDCLPSERMNLQLLAGEMAYNNTKKKEEISDVIEGMELNSSIIAQDVLMSSPEKLILLQNNTSQEEEIKISLCQSVLRDRDLTTESQLLDSTDLNCSNPFTHVERRHQDHARHISFGGNLITFSPLRPLSGEQPEEF
ncbi:disks large-associated protein 5 isoform X2 [Tamandua tetradactyla]|uniref:disks large-associated protein 5 isoform X2 n=1 Tax=Tamandua tetradactyla TaxID=48850 RepID=UPI004053FD34